MARSCGVGGGWLVSRFFFSRRVIPALALLSALAGSGSGATTESIKSQVGRLLTDAAQAEAKGDTARSLELLQEAIRDDPENQLARWQLGQVKVDKQWTAAEEVQRQAAADPLQAEYRERRAAAGESASEQLAIAKWARKKGLTDEARFHWASVLAKDPKNAEALHALDLHWQDGRLMSSEQIADQKERTREAKRAAERWKSKIVGWCRAVAGQDSAARDTALAEIGAVNEADAIPSLEELTLGRESRDQRTSDARAKIAVAFISALGKMQGQASTESLARHAVFASDESARRLAVERLKPRDQHDYIPILLGALGMPIEASYSVTTGPDGSVHYLRSLFREGPENDWSWDSRRAVIQRDLSDHVVRLDLNRGTIQDSQTPAQKVRSARQKVSRAAAYQERYTNDAAATESQVTQANEATETLNSRIVPVLAEATGEHYGDNPKNWWDWWRNKNEYYSADHPVTQYYSSGVDSFNYFDYTIPEPEHHSCFGKGTLVWTKTGRKAIETIEAGDLVLSQNVDTGELKYKTVLRRTQRPAGPLLNISTDRDELRVTGGHVLWVAGVGWRMAKELGDDAVLHSVSKPLVVRSAKPAADGEAYNLIVADFNTYFVGESGVLAHDITPRRPTQSVLPGIPKSTMPKSQTASN